MSTAAAFGDGYPRVRPNLRYVRQTQDGKPMVVVKDPVRLKYFRFGEVESWLMQRMDGSRSIARIAVELEEEHGVRADSASIDVFHRKLREMGLAERTGAERSVLILEALRQQRRSRLRSPGNTIFRMRVSLGDPDRLLERLVHPLRFFWTPAFVAVSILAFLLFGLIVAAEWSTFGNGFLALFDPASYTLGFVATLYITTAAILVIHELGHGLTCKHFGGEVHEIGAMILYFSPGMFCNVSDAWTFERKSHRLWVTFAGSWIQLLVATLAAVVWLAVEPGTAAHRIAFVAMLVGGVYTVLLNLNPLIPLDGYYALMDWLEIPNLRARSFDYLAASLRRSLLDPGARIPPATDRERKIFLAYGVAATAYLALLVILVAVWVGTVLGATFGLWGWAVVALGPVLALRHRLARAGRAMLDRAWSRRSRRPPRRVAMMAAGVAAALLVLLLLPWDIRVNGVAEVEPTQRVSIRPAEEGWVERVRVAEGEWVGTGDTLAVLRNPELEMEWLAARAAVGTAERALGSSREATGTVDIRLAEQRLTAERARFAELDRRRSTLVLRAPFPGQVVTLRPHELIGARLAPGDSLLELWNGDRQVRVTVAQRHAGDIGSGARIGIKFPAQADVTWRTRVERIGTAATDGQVVLYAPLSSERMLSEDLIARPGMVGRARIVAAESTLGGMLLYLVNHTLRWDWFL
jgi:putative peptide zinc metalloprotease protein